MPTSRQGEHSSVWAEAAGAEAPAWCHRPLGCSSQTRQEGHWASPGPRLKPFLLRPAAGQAELPGCMVVAGAVDRRRGPPPTHPPTYHVHSPRPLASGSTTRPGERWQRPTRCRQERRPATCTERRLNAVGPSSYWLGPLRMGCARVCLMSFSCGPAHLPFVPPLCLLPPPCAHAAGRGGCL